MRSRKPWLRDGCSRQWLWRSQHKSICRASHPCLQIGVNRKPFKRRPWANGVLAIRCFTIHVSTSLGSTGRTAEHRIQSNHVSIMSARNDCEESPYFFASACAAAVHCCTVTCPKVTGMLKFSNADAWYEASCERLQDTPAYHTQLCTSAHITKARLCVILLACML